MLHQVLGTNLTTKLITVLLHWSVFDKDCKMFLQWMIFPNRIWCPTITMRFSQ